MALKVAAILALVAVASAGVLPEQLYGSPPVGYDNGPPAGGHHHAQPDDDFDPHPQYKFGYDVQDSISGDNKSQHEERDGDVVRGEYSLIDADGFKRTVQYTADDANGFNAVVSRVPVDGQAQNGQNGQNGHNGHNGQNGGQAPGEAYIPPAEYPPYRQ